ncbi:putative carboxylesterase [Hyaloscypha variabilis]
MIEDTAAGYLPATVRTSSGSVEGHFANKSSGVSEYLGIPFAKPPVGDLRWAPPEPFVGLGVIKGTEFGDTCPAITQPKSASGAEGVNLTPQGIEILTSILWQVNVTYSEDCLTLNIWTKPQTGERKKAVLFWIYGGGFTTGTTNNAAYNGQYIADQEDVVVVSVNYRLGIFGFPGAPNARNNLGLLDQRLALEWVRDNIEGFGGDPERITIFGESAGGSSVDYHSFAFTSDPIAAGYIAQSGTVFSPQTQASPAQSAAAWYQVAEILGCGNATSDPDEVLASMRSKDWQTILNAIPTSSRIEGVTGGFSPTVDEIVVFSNYTERAAAGNFTKRPLLIGSNDNEIGLFRVTFGLQNITYPDATWNYLQEQIFTCPIGVRALASANNHSPVWRYRYFGNFPNLKLSTDPDSGAWHGSEVTVIFGTDMAVQNIVERTSEEENVGKYLRGAWAAFAKDPAEGLVNYRYGLPEYKLNGTTLLRLGYNNAIGPNLANPNQYDSGCPQSTT